METLLKIENLIHKLRNVSDTNHSESYPSEVFRYTKIIPNWLVSPPRHHKMECQTTCEGPKNVLILLFRILFSLDRVKGELLTA